MRRFAQASADLDTAIQLADRPYLRFLRGLVSCQRGALEDAKRLLALAPQQGETYYAMGVALAGLGHAREAVGAFDESLRRRPELIDPLVDRAAAYVALDDTPRARADLAEAARRKAQRSSFAASEDPFRY